MMNTILERHYLNTRASALRDDPADHADVLRAVDCAALHVGLDAMARIQTKRKPQAGCVASYPPIARRDAYEVADTLDDVLRAHSARTPYRLGGHPAWHVAEHYAAMLG